MFPKLPFIEVFKDASGGNIKTPRNEFLEYGEIPIVDQGQSLIAGFVNDWDRVCRATPPVIIFGDHTRVIKYVDFQFAMGADGTKVLVPKVESDTKYLYHALNAIEIPAAGYSRHYKFLKKVQIPLPPLPEQKRIAAILDAADNLRAKRRESLAQLDTLLQSTFLEMFGDPVTNPMGWEVSPLNEIASRVTDGTHQSPQWSESGIPFLFVSNIGERSISFQTSKFISRAEHERLTARCPIEPGDILYTTVGSYGNPALVRKSTGDFAFQRHIAHIKPNHDLIDAQFLEVMLDSPMCRQQADRLARGVAQKTLNLRELKSFQVLVPPIDKQHRFATIVESVERQKTRLRAHLAELDILFASLQSRAFNGEL